MQHSIWAWVLLGICSVSVISRAGTERGSGGDSVYCTPGEGAYSGYYALDYLLTSEENDSDRPVASWEDSLKRISGLLRQRSPYLADSFEDFTRHINNHSNFRLPKLWEKSAFGIVDLKDEKMIRMLPPNCYKKSETGGANIIQMVYRQEKPTITIYTYDAKIMNQLAVERPLQLSYLFVHEWLWDLTTDVAAIRRVNHLLHSKEVENLDLDAFYETIRAMGLMRSDGFVSVCSRSEEVRKEIETYVGLPCEQIEFIKEKTGNYHEVVRFDKRGLSNLKPTDFSGLVEFKWFTLNENKLRTLPEWIFLSTPNAERIELMDNPLEKLYEYTFDGLSLDTILFERSGKVKLPKRIFSHARKIENIYLHLCPGLDLPAGIFAGVNGLRRLVVNNNQWNRFPEGIFDGLDHGISVDARGNSFSQEYQSEMKAKYREHVHFMFGDPF